MLAAHRERVLVRREYAVTWLKLQASAGALDLSLLEALQASLITTQSPERR
jgi:hypothetical protein